MSISDINSRGQVSGWASTEGGELGFLQTSAFIWQDGAMQRLPMLLEGDVSFGKGINDHGTVVGGESTPNGLLPVVWRAGSVRTLPLPVEEGSGIAIDINDSGEIVGELMFESCLYWASEIAEPISFGLEGGECRVHAINDQGIAVGESRDASGTTTAFVASRGVITAVSVGKRGKTIPQAYSSLFSISDSGLAVGEFLEFAGETYPLVWSASEGARLLSNRYRAYAVTPSGSIVLSDDTPVLGGHILLLDRRGRLSDLGTLGEGVGIGEFVINDRRQVAWTASELEEPFAQRSYFCQL